MMRIFHRLHFHFSYVKGQIEGEKGEFHLKWIWRWERLLNYTAITRRTNSQFLFFAQSVTHVIIVVWIALMIRMMTMMGSFWLSTQFLQRAATRPDPEWSERSSIWSQNRLGIRIWNLSFSLGEYLSLMLNADSNSFQKLGWPHSKQPAAHLISQLLSSILYQILLNKW